MSKTTIFGDCPLIERLTNDEFFKILQHLSLEQYALTQVFIPKRKWVPVLDVNLQKLQIKCSVCNMQVRFEDVKDHIKQNGHSTLLRSNVKQFYHPFFTYGKIDIKLARGEDTPHDVRQNALFEVNKQIKNFKKECIFAKQFSEAAERRSREIGKEEIIEINRNKMLINPDEMVVLVNLPLEDITKLRFCVGNQWQNVFSYKYLTKNTTFLCNICLVNCCGVESLNSHLKGYAHNSRQLQLYALCYEGSSKVNKNCCIQFGNSFYFSVKDCAMNSYRNRENADRDLWITKLHNEIAKKVKPLMEQAVKIFAGEDNSASFEFNDKLGHLGVEYVLKIMKSENDGDPKFECSLCEFVGDGKDMQRHLLLFDHKKKYLDLHYRDTMKKYESLVGEMRYEEFLAVMREIVHKVAVEIENHHSRSLPYTVSLADYNSRRQQLIADIYALLHASQIRGPSFSNAISREHMRHLKSSANQLISNETFKYPGFVIFTVPPKDKIYLNQMSHDPVIRLREYNAKFKSDRPLKTGHSISPTRDHVGNVAIRGDSRSERSRAPVHHRSRSRSPIHGGERTFQRISDGGFYPSRPDIWDIYRREIAVAAKKIEIAYESFRKNPESHPLYEDEWNNFWQRRKKELEREGYDHRAYNFQPEWVQYFKQRIEFLFGEDLHKSQIDIRHRLNIPLDAEEDCQRPAQIVNQHTAVHHQKRSGKLVEEEYPVSKGNIRQSSPEFRSCDPQTDGRVLGQRKKDIDSEKSRKIISKINDNHSNVIHVLRLMTALEEHLGSLGGKVMDLLSNALQLEKYFSGDNNEFEARVLTSDNCNLLETAMEKLKGILFAGLLDEQKLSGFSRVITCTASLLRYAEKKGWRQENNLFDKKDFPGNSKSRAMQSQHFGIQSSIHGEVSTQASADKALSDTLMDLAKETQERKQKNFGKYSTEQLNLPDCPPPPNIHGLTRNTNLFAGFKQDTPNSGLASFDTKLSLDELHYARAVSRDLAIHTDIEQLQRKIVSGGNNIYNNSFKNNNETRTNINSGTSSMFLSSKVIPKMGQNHTVYQGADGGGNHTKNWLQWTHPN